MPDTNMDINPESTPEHASAVAQRLVNGEIPNDQSDLQLLVERLQQTFEDQSSNAIVRERAFISLYYILAQSPDDEEQSAERAQLNSRLRSLLVSAAEQSASFEEEKLRGRAHWIAIMLFDEGATPEQIRRYIEQIALAGETSEYVWERVFAAVGNTQHASEIVPVPETWLPKQPPRTYNQLLRRAYDEVDKAGATLSRTKERVRELIEAYLAGEISHTAIGNLLESLHGTLRAYVLPAEDLQTLLIGTAWFQRAEIIQQATRGATGEDLEAVSEYIKVIQTIAADTPSADAHEWCSAELTEISLDLLRYRIGTEIDTDALAARLVRFIETPLPETMKSSPALYTVYQVVGHAVNRIASTTPEFVDSLCRNEPLMKSLLESEQPYLQLIGANIVLIASRNGELPAEVKRIARARFDANPETKNAFATGGDIKPDEYAMPEQAAVVAPVAENADEVGGAEAQGFFNLEGLTGMLEMCQLPHIAWRLREAIDRSEADSETPVLSAPVMMSLQTEPGEDLQHTLIDDRRPGPGSFAWIAESFRTLSGLHSHEERERWQMREADRIEQKLRERRQRGQRNAIRRVFEGGHLDGGTPLDRVMTAISGLGRLEMDHEMHPIGNTNDERSIDYLAWYLSEAHLPTDYKHGFGIYFNVPRILRYAESIAAPVATVVEVIAVHELFHAFVEVTLASDYRNKRSKHRWAGDLEEAAANYYAYEHLRRLGSDGRIDQRMIEKVRRTLFAHAGEPEHGLNGYGEYHYLDSSACVAVPTMIAPAPGQKPVRPRNYAAESAVVLRGTSLAASVRDQQWNMVRRGIEHPTIPMYLEFI